MTAAARRALAVLATTGLGVVVLLDLGAPPRLWAPNLVAGFVGVALVIGLARIAGPVLRRPGPVLFAVTAALAATAIWGVELEGVRRWAAVGPLNLHVGFVLLPAALAAMSMARGPIQAAAAALIGATLVLQPDAGTATAFALGMGGLAVWSRARWTILAAGIASLAVVAAWLRPDPLAPVTFVEGVAPLALAQGPLIGLGALLAMAAPSLLLAACGTWPPALFWAGAALASLAGAFPQPILGGGVGPILGYAVTWGLLAGFDARMEEL